MRISVNGDAHEVPEQLSVAALLAQIGLSDVLVAVERNHEIVPRAAHASTLLVDGDSLEIVQFVGGG